ncbi:fungal-specific transcription factor domain-containing protein [Xylaria sp. FL1777]|nr:fungal-specific transcription factor domain-containing protein [Xylaria sp. FL1777]
MSTRTVIKPSLHSLSYTLRVPTAPFSANVSVSNRILVIPETPKTVIMPASPLNPVPGAESKVVCRLLTSPGDGAGIGPENKPIQLSWPNGNDKRRARVADPCPPSQCLQKLAVLGNETRHGLHIVDVSSDDIRRHHHLTTAVSDASGPSLETLPSWNPSQTDVDDAELLEHFYHSASQSLAVFGRDRAELGHALVRIALMNDSKSSRAVWLSLLAFSATHRHDVYVQPVQLKISALEIMATAKGNEMGTKEAIQHIAAGMLLCSLEIQSTSCTSGQWIHYLDGVKDVIQAANLTEITATEPDLAILLEWVYYHDVLLRLTQQYWPLATPDIRLQLSHATSPAIGVVALLSDLFDAVAPNQVPTPSAETSDEHKSFLKILDWKIRNISIEDIVGDDRSDDVLMNAEVYKLAMLVYIHRASSNMLGQTAVTQQYIDEAFARFAEMTACHRQFPVFILGCEARTDSQRVTVLDLIARTGQHHASRSLEQIKILIEAIWVQEDLANGEIDYKVKLKYVFGCCRNVPSFV